MTQENKELLLKDLYSRLPYGIKVEYRGTVCTLDCICTDGSCLLIDKEGKSLPFLEEGLFIPVEELKPYLFHMSSMTKEQLDQLYIDSRVIEDPADILDALANDMDAIDWLNAHHFDYRGLIEKGLAIDCTNLNIY